jgi:hypothetical protein
MTRRDLLAFLRLAPPATLVPAAEVLAALEQDLDDQAPAPAAGAGGLPACWRERLWCVPDERAGLRGDRAA